MFVIVAMLLTLHSLAAPASTSAGTPLRHTSAKPSPDQPASSDSSLARTLGAAAHSLKSSPTDYDALIRRIGDARIVLLGEDTHGTREFYIERARISQRLIAEHGFAGVVIEGDWGEAAALRPLLGGTAPASDVDRYLAAFRRFPQWMWSNTDFRDLILWMQHWNAQRRSDASPAAILGMDLYDIQSSVHAVLGYLARVSPDAAARARSRYACLETSAGAGEPSTSPGVGGSPGSVTTNEPLAARPRWPAIDCAQDVQAPLTELVTGAVHDGFMVLLDNAEYVEALQNARVVRDGENYMRAMHTGSDAAWNIRDTHMAGTIDLMLAHLDAKTGARSKLVVWAHNAHVGDVRATSMGEAGYVSLGQLLRERYLDDAVIVGFMTGIGTVRAAFHWGGPDRSMPLTPPLPRSHAALLHRTGHARSYVVFSEMTTAVRDALAAPRLQRGIGVRYVKKLEVAGGHYYAARLAAQYDAVVYIARTRALQRVVTDGRNRKSAARL